MENSEEDLVVEKFGDETIAIIRELMQLALITGTNIVDHLRAVEVCKDSETGKLIPTENYVLAYNAMIDEIAQKAKEAQEAESAALSGVDDADLELPVLGSADSTEEEGLN